ncbi:Imm32 family immunity protein [Labedaea rhizosphaerae]|uniref:Uncharacterized protein n=1 Tax=Labedaea rhizosphaerae TaxID=598644 RepID=A0A4R6SLB4_LABRH|nr:hypothetical protein [Labedaea rhizosphaerae]TDQ04082.1 hypothetical protein EV186_10122 [Labedaea rhizosphaerae]
MIVALDRRFGEMSIFGTAAEYRRFADLVRAGGGAVDLEAEADVDPFDEPLARIVVRRTDATTVTLAREDRDLVLSGPAEHLHTIAHIFDESADQDGAGGNVHLDPYPGHHYLDERSASVILNDPGAPRLGAAYREWLAEQQPPQ